MTKLTSRLLMMVDNKRIIFVTLLLEEKDELDQEVKQFQYLSWSWFLWPQSWYPDMSAPAPTQSRCLHHLHGRLFVTNPTSPWRQRHLVEEWGSSQTLSVIQHLHPLHFWDQIEDCWCRCHQQAFSPKIIQQLKICKRIKQQNIITNLTDGM